MEIKKLNIDDIQFKNLALEFAEESGTDLNFPHFYESWNKLEDAGMGKSIGAYIDGSLIGILGILIHSDLFSGKTSCNETFWFVTKDHRKSTAGSRLFNKMHDICKEYGCKYINVAHFEGLGAESVKRFYLKSGFSKFESFYRKCA